MSLLSFDQLFQEADAQQAPVPVAVAGGADPTVLQALRRACDRGWVRPIVAGREPDIARTASEHHVALGGFTLLDVEDAAAAAVGMVRSGSARLLMKGQIATPALMAAVLHPVDGLRTERVICQEVLMEVRPAGRRFLLADTGICISPTLDERIDILRQAAATAHALGVEVPRVAVLSATETATPKMPDTLEAADLQHRSSVGEFRHCVVQGPLSFDLAYAPDAADRKRIGGPVVGAADVFLFPNLLAANLTVKAIMYTADCRFGGVLCGAACPVVFMSRADSTETRLNSLALALKLARHQASPDKESGR
jgi:phosphotransacetylase